MQRVIVPVRVQSVIDKAGLMTNWPVYESSMGSDLQLVVRDWQYAVQQLAAWQFLAMHGALLLQAGSSQMTLHVKPLLKPACFSAVVFCAGMTLCKMTASSRVCCNQETGILVYPFMHRFLVPMCRTESFMAPFSFLGTKECILLKMHGSSSSMLGRALCRC